MMAGRKFERKRGGWSVTREVQILMKKFVAMTLKRGQFLQFLDRHNSQPTPQKIHAIEEKSFLLFLSYFISIYNAIRIKEWKEEVEHFFYGRFQKKKESSISISKTSI